VGARFFRTRSDWPWGLPYLLYKGYRVSFQEIKWQGCGDDHPPPYSAEVKETVELYTFTSLWVFMAGYREKYIYLFINTISLHNKHVHLDILRISHWYSPGVYDF
jgi:hypothetical protein